MSIDLSPSDIRPVKPVLLDEPLRAPFPYFGGKMRAAALVWERFGQVTNFVEPFFGSGAVLLSCPNDRRPRVETVNDINCFVANFFRATRSDSEAVARWADEAVNETELHVRHRWLLRMARLLRARLEADPGYYDARVAGWWVWGASAWIGSGWCEEGVEPSLKIPDCGASRLNGEAHINHGKGIHGLGMRAPSAQLPNLGGATDTGGATPNYGGGVHALRTRAPSTRLPDLSGGTQWGTDEPNARAGRGIHSERARGPSRKLPSLGSMPNESGTGGDGSRGVHTRVHRTRLYDIFAALSARLRYTRVACGDWARICTPAVTYRHGLTAVFLDPPYPGYGHVYGSADDITPAVRAWALENGARDDMRIAYCGYEGDAPELEAAGWEVVSWRAKGGYANQRTDGENVNKHRERIWFSPACLRPGERAAREVPRHDDLPLFARRTP